MPSALDGDEPGWTPLPGGLGKLWFLKERNFGRSTRWGLSDGACEVHAFNKRLEITTPDQKFDMNDLEGVDPIRAPFPLFSMGIALAIMAIAITWMVFLIGEPLIAIPVALVLFAILFRVGWIWATTDYVKVRNEKRTIYLTMPLSVRDFFMPRKANELLDTMRYFIGPLPGEIL